MPSAVAFLQWVYLDQPITIGPLRLLPYHRGKLPGPQPRATQADIDAVLNAYSNRPRNKIKKATILELGEWQTGTDPENALPALFRARNALAFAALSRRRLFRQDFDYCNYDTYSLVVQRYAPGDVGTFAFTSRRRDGGTTQLWSADEFAFHRPNHVDPHAKLVIDEPLLAALLSPPEPRPSLFEALIEFNCANTDSPDVPGHVEVVMAKSAFEWLLEIGEQANELVSGLKGCLKDIPPVDTPDGPLAGQWKSARPGGARPLEAWAREFCDIRGASAHGKPRSAPRFVWAAHAHLAFASVLFPLIFKKCAADAGLLQLEKYDVERLRRIDSYLVHDPFTFDWRVEYATHPWVKLDTLAFVYARAHTLY